MVRWEIGGLPNSQVSNHIGLYPVPRSAPRSRWGQMYRAFMVACSAKEMGCCIVRHAFALIHLPALSISTSLISNLGVPQPGRVATVQSGEVASWGEDG